MSITAVKGNNSQNSIIENLSNDNGNFNSLFSTILATAKLSAQKKSSASDSESKSQLSQQAVKSTAKTTSAKKTTVNPNATFVATGGQVVVSVKQSYSDNVNRIYWSTDNFKTRHYLSNDNQRGNYSIGTFAAGTQIEFGIDNGKGSFFRTGAAGFNPDGMVHALVSKSKNSSNIRFEDSYGGGDQDFNDVILTATNKAKSSSSTSSSSASGSYPALNPSKSLDTVSSIGLSDSLGTWLPQSGLEGNDLNRISSLVSQSLSMSINDLFTTIKNLVANNKLVSTTGFDWLNNDDLKLSASNTSQVNTINQATALSDLELTIKKLSDMSEAELNASGLKKLISIDSVSTVASSKTSALSLSQITSTSLSTNTQSSNTNLQNINSLSTSVTSVEIKLLKAIYTVIS